jgi:hypothetical protein
MPRSHPGFGTRVTILVALSACQASPLYGIRLAEACVTKKRPTEVRAGKMRKAEVCESPLIPSRHAGL